MTITVNAAIEMLQSAIELLKPIEIEFEGIKYNYLPQVSENFADWEIPQEVFIGISDYGIPSLVIGNQKNRQQISCEVDFASQEKVNFAVTTLWDMEVQEFFKNSKDIRKEAWTQGSEYWQKIESILENPATIFVVSWKKFCQYSQNFTNGSYAISFNPNYVYLDNSGGFKTRGAWSNEHKLVSVDADEIIFDAIRLKPVTGQSIDHAFGAWDAYQPQYESIFFFQSCNGNSLVGWVDDDDEVTVYLDNEDCNYAKFFQA